MNHQMKDPYTAVWLSHSSIKDFLDCPRAYFLKNVYRNPISGKKIKLSSPSLSLGQIIHETLENLSWLPTNRRFETPLAKTFLTNWQKISGEKGGFSDSATEDHYRQEGLEIIAHTVKHPGPLERLAVKIKMDLPHFWLSEEDSLILCGKIDWLEYLKESDSLHIIDFKTGKNKEDKDSLQLPIYHLITSQCQHRPITQSSYWYLREDDEPKIQKLPSLEKTKEKLLKIGKKIKLARQLAHFKCPQGNGCPACLPFERILRGEGRLVGLDNYGQEIYLLPSEKTDLEKDSVLL